MCKRYVFKKDNKDLYYRGNKVYPLCHYSEDFGNNQLALFYWETELGLGGYWEKEAHCSANVFFKLDEDLVIIKNYSENEGMLEWLMKNEIITSQEFILYDSYNGYQDFPVCKLNLKYFKEYKCLGDNGVIEYEKK